MFKMIFCTVKCADSQNDMIKTLGVYCEKKNVQSEKNFPTTTNRCYNKLIFLELWRLFNLLIQLQFQKLCTYYVPIKIYSVHVMKA